jgi:hypothetical protein
LQPLADFIVSGLMLSGETRGCLPDAMIEELCMNGYVVSAVCLLIY